LASAAGCLPCTVPTRPFRYRSPDEDSARWLDFVHRPGDIVISTRSKSGTTWMQMICALLVFRTADLAVPLATLSPWLDWLVLPWDEVSAGLEAQQHRRFIKTHTPLDGIPLDHSVTYIVVCRHPLDAAVSLYHQAENLDRVLMRRLAGQPEPADRPAAALPLREWLLAWIDREVEPREDLDSLPGFMWHLSDAWSRREMPNVVLAHYDDLLADLEAQMRRLAAILRLAVPEQAWPRLVTAAGFPAMRDRAADVIPNVQGIFKDESAFFRRGRSGAARELLTDDEVARYHDRAAQNAPADLLRWLHREDGGPT
jgi:aryl sulfotransferase